MKKICRKCNKEWEIEMFTKSKECKNGRTHTCKKCMSLYVFKRKNVNKIKVTNLFGENWLDITGTNGVYQVSNLGRVKSLVYYGEEIILKPHFDRDGYLRVGLTKNKKYGGYLIHRLVAYEFIPNPENKPQINHKKGIKHDNRVSELEWNTMKENFEHAKKNNLTLKGERNPKAKLTEKDVLKIREEYPKIGYGALSKLGRKYGVKHCTISDIITRKKWKHI